MAGEIFSSYPRSGEPRAPPLYRLLKERGVEAWYDARVTPDLLGLPPPARAIEHSLKARSTPEH